MLNAALESCRPTMTLQDYNDINEYIMYGEFGLAYELLKFVLEKGNIQCPDGLEKVRKMMNLH